MLPEAIVAQISKPSNVDIKKTPLGVDKPVKILDSSNGK
jgi:hypothetical protein